MSKKKALKVVLKELGSINDSYEDILWSDLECNLGQIRSLTVEEWLRKLHKRNVEGKVIKRR